MKIAVAAALGWLVIAFAARADDFDVSAYEKKALEWKGYVELAPEGLFLRRDSTGYLLQYPGESHLAEERLNAAAELSGVLRHRTFRFELAGYAASQLRRQNTEGILRLNEAYGSWQPGAGLTLEIGKRSLRWGKGYAWNPLAFLERPKDPTDPDLSREGFVVAGGEWIQSFGGALQTLALSAILIPTLWDLNDDFGSSDQVNFSFKLYTLLLDTDLDLVYARIYSGAGTSGHRFGFDFSRNLGSNLEVHGEWTHTTEAPLVTIDPDGQIARRTSGYTSWLAGLRFLTEGEATFIVEYYRHGAGYAKAEGERFHDLVRGSAADAPLFELVKRAASQRYSRPNAMRNYVYARAAQKEPFDFLYFTPALTVFANLDDWSMSVIPEAVYTGVDNLELRLRLAVNLGRASTEYGEKAIRSRVELRARYFF